MWPRRLPTNSANSIPATRPTFTANAKTFSDSLAPINAAIANIKSKYSNAPIGYTERVDVNETAPGEYACIDVATVGDVPASFEEARQHAIDIDEARAEEKKIKVLLYNGQVTSPATEAIKQLAQKSSVPVVGVTETLPPTDKDFQGWQLRQINELTTALGG
jgi:zinc/manganese transport system substrate-binding protein